MEGGRWREGGVEDSGRKQQREERTGRQGEKGIKEGGKGMTEGGKDRESREEWSNGGKRGWS